MIDGKRESLLQNYSNDRLLFIFEMNVLKYIFYLVMKGKNVLNIIYKMRVNVIY